MQFNYLPFHMWMLIALRLSKFEKFECKVALNSELRIWYFYIMIMILILNHDSHIGQFSSCSFHFPLSYQHSLTISSCHWSRYYNAIWHSIDQLVISVICTCHFEITKMCKARQQIASKDDHSEWLPTRDNYLLSSVLDERAYTRTHTYSQYVFAFCLFVC